MLVLSRRAEQRIHIGDDIILTVIEVDRGIVRLGFEAPFAVVIDREEVRIKRDREGRTDGDRD